MATIQPRQDPAGYVIRSARENDAAALIRLIDDIIEEGAFSNTEPGEQRLTVERQRQWIRDHLEAPQSLLIVAEQEGRVIGLLNFENGAKRRLSHQGSFGMTLAPAHRSRGIGRVLLDTLITWAQADPVLEKINLTVLSNNQRAIAFYQAAGFREQGRLPRQVKLAPGHYADHILMYRFVDPSAELPTC